MIYRLQHILSIHTRPPTTNDLGLHPDPALQPPRSHDLLLIICTDLSFLLGHHAGQRNPYDHHCGADVR